MDRNSLTSTALELDVHTLRSKGWRRTLGGTTFRSLRHRDYKLYFFGQLVSFIGTWMQSAAMMWLVFEETQQAFAAPLLLVATVGPTLLLGPIGGALADRNSKKRVVFISQCCFLGTSLLLVALMLTGHAHSDLLLMVAFINGVIQAVDVPTRLAYVPDLVPKKDLINAVSLNALLFNSARAIGPALAGLLFLIAEIWPGERPVFYGALACFSFNALSYGAVLFALSRIRANGDPVPSLVKSSTFEGIQYLRTHAALGLLLILTGLVSIFGWPTLTLFPAYTKLVLGHTEKEYSFLVSALGGGALVGALTTATYGSVRRRGLFLITGSFVAALGILGLSLATITPAAVFCSAAVGFGLILFLSTGQSTLQLSVDGVRRGRVLALWAMTLSASAPLGHLLAGVAATNLGIPFVLRFLAGGMAVTGIFVTILVRTGLNRLETKDSGNLGKPGKD